MPVAATGLVLGWLADRVIGDPVRGHPVAGFGRLAQGLERLAWRPARLPGVLHVAVLAAGAAGAAALGWRLASSSDNWLSDSSVGEVTLNPNARTTSGLIRNRT